MADTTALGQVPNPKFILRGHKTAVHAAAFVRQNARLATGDSEGFVVLWDLATMRPKVVWRAHENAILGISGWGNDKIITHGRDHKLIVWKVTENDEGDFSTSLPLDGPSVDRKNPWTLHLLEVNTMNFCAFAACPLQDSGSILDSSSEILLAVPNTLASEAVDIYALPSQIRTHTVKPGSKNGMAMSLSLIHHHSRLTLVGGFENGYASVHQLSPTGNWILTYRTQAHSQPILSLDVHVDAECFFTSGADAIIAKHPIPREQQQVAKPFDPSQRVVEEIDSDPMEGGSLLSAALAREPPGERSGTSATTLQEWKHPIKTINTKHSGQQSLTVRSDGGIFATAGWDSKIRVYSSKSLKELAVLKWHKDGAYAVTFADIGHDPSHGSLASQSQSNVSDADAVVSLGGMSVRERRNHRAKATHWLAAGAKDGKVSLWDIY